MAAAQASVRYGQPGNPPSVPPQPIPAAKPLVPAFGAVAAAGGVPVPPLVLAKVSAVGRSPVVAAPPGTAVTTAGSTSLQSVSGPEAGAAPIAEMLAAAAAAAGLNVNDYIQALLRGTPHPAAPQPVGAKPASPRDTARESTRPGSSARTGGYYDYHYHYDRSALQ